MWRTYSCPLWVWIRCKKNMWDENNIWINWPQSIYILSFLLLLLLLQLDSAYKAMEVSSEWREPGYYPHMTSLQHTLQTAWAKDDYPKTNLWSKPKQGNWLVVPGSLVTHSGSVVLITASSQQQPHCCADWQTQNWEPWCYKYPNTHNTSLQVCYWFLPKRCDDQNTRILLQNTHNS